MITVKLIEINTGVTKHFSDTKGLDGTMILVNETRKSQL